MSYDSDESQISVDLPTEDDRKHELMLTPPKIAAALGFPEERILAALESGEVDGAVDIDGVWLARASAVAFRVAVVDCTARWGEQVCEPIYEGPGADLYIGTWQLGRRGGAELSMAGPEVWLNAHYRMGRMGAENASWQVGGDPAACGPLTPLPEAIRRAEAWVADHRAGRREAAKGRASRRAEWAASFDIFRRACVARWGDPCLVDGDARVNTYLGSWAVGGLGLVELSVALDEVWLAARSPLLPRDAEPKRWRLAAGRLGAAVAGPGVAPVSAMWEAMDGATAWLFEQLPAPTPTEDHVVALAADSPEALAAWMESGTMDAPLLSYAAEYLGAAAPARLARRVLIPLLDHPKVYVREGAIYGLHEHLSGCALAAVERIAEHDPVAALRDVAQEYLSAVVGRKAVS